jgi:ligand-binding sensor domain-containing protein
MKKELRHIIRWSSFERLWLCLAFFVFFNKPIIAGNGYVLTKIGYNVGLSNSAILSICQDQKGLLWFGTYDGLNNFDSKTMSVYRADTKSRLINNVIDCLNIGKDNSLWITASTGISRFSTDKRQALKTYKALKNNFALFSNRQGITWGIDNASIYLYNYSTTSFRRVANNHLYNKALSFVDEKGHLWLFSHSSKEISLFSLPSSNNKNISKEVTNIHNKRIIYTCYQNGILCFIDEDNDLFMYDLSRNMKMYIRNVTELMARYGSVQGIIPFQGDIMIAFLQNGLIKLNASEHYKESIVDRSLRIFCLYKDNIQDIIWIGTDGHGVMAYYKRHSLATHMMFSELQNKVTRQVRSIITDKKGGLWFGTKGDGLIHIPNYIQSTGNNVSNGYVYFPGSKTPLASYSRRLTEYQVFTLSRSRYMNGFWIGASDSPTLAYYDTERDAVTPISNKPLPFARVHGIYEENNKVLWLTTSGEGFWRIGTERRNGRLLVKDMHRFIFYSGGKEIKDFYPLLSEGNILWLGSRGMGLVKFNMKTKRYKVYSLGESSSNDILSLYKKQNRLYVGTVSGLLILTFNKQGKIDIHSIDEKSGFLNDMIHGILEDRNGFLWLSTNKGLVKYNPKNNAFHTYYNSNDLQISEFSDDAYYRCPYTGNLFFGGIDGLLYLSDKLNKSGYYPKIMFRNLTLEARPVNFSDFYNAETNILSLHGTNLFFSVSFVAPDFVDGVDIEYSYKLEGAKTKDWTSFSPENVASFNSLPSGDYTLSVRYKRSVEDTNYRISSLKIHIQPPWYLSRIAFIFYFLIIAVVIVYIYKFVKGYFYREKQIKELTLHEHLNTSMGNITSKFHEMNGSFATIYRACARLRQYESMPTDYYKLLDAIHETVLSFAFNTDDIWDEKLNFNMYLPQSDLSCCDIRIKDLSDEIFRMLVRRGYNNLLDLHISIDKDLIACLPKNALGYMLFYLYSEALKQKGILDIGISSEGGKLTLTLPSILYSSIDFEKPDAIKEEIPNKDFQSSLYKWLYIYATKVMHIEITSRDKYCLLQIPLLQPKVSLSNIQANKKHILLLEDKAELEWLIKDILSDDYEIYSVQTVQSAFSYLRKHSPDLFLADTLIYLKEENKFIEYVQMNKGLLMNTAFVPMLTWKANFLLHKELYSLIDGFVTMPYNILFLNLNNSQSTKKGSYPLPCRQKAVTLKC